MRPSMNRARTSRAAARSGWAAVLIAVIAATLVAQGPPAQVDRPGKSDFDPTRKGVWRFLDDNLGDLLEQGERAYQKGDFQAAATHYLAYLYRNGRDTRVIYNLARCYSRMGNAEAAVEVLTRASLGGFVYPELLESDKELGPIRETPVFKDHQKKIASQRERLGQTILVNGPRANRCRLRVPASRTPGKAFPLVVGLHGNGSNPDDMMQVMTAEAFPGMIVAAPEGAYPRDDMTWMPGGHFSWHMLNTDRALWPVIDPPTSDFILAVVEEISRTLPVSDVVLLGFSQGVSAAYLAAMKRPERLAAVVAFAGAFPAEWITPEQIKAGSRLRVMIAHGTADKQIGLQQSERARDLLREAGYRVQFETFDGGHTLPPDVMRRAGEWIRTWAAVR
jgi:phospholipase/carboxylesterase